MVDGVLEQLDSALGLDATLERTLDLVGVFFFAVSGGLVAVRKGFELVGVVALSLVTALGGGVIRDVVLGATPPTAFSDVLYLVVPLAAAAIVFVAHGPIDRRLGRPVLLFDAAGLGLFSVTGAVKASAFEASAVGAVLIGVISAVGGGIMRDVLAQRSTATVPSRQPALRHPGSSGRHGDRGRVAKRLLLRWPCDCRRRCGVLDPHCVVAFRLAGPEAARRSPVRLVSTRDIHPG